MITPGALLLVSGGLAVPTWLAMTREILRASLTSVLFWGLGFGLLGLVAAVVLLPVVFFQVAHLMWSSNKQEAGRCS